MDLFEKLSLVLSPSNKKIPFLILLTSVAAILPQPALAASITYSYQSGTIPLIPDATATAPNCPPNASFSGTFTFDDLQPNSSGFFGASTYNFTSSGVVFTLANSIGSGFATPEAQFQNGVLISVSGNAHLNAPQGDLLGLSSFGFGYGSNPANASDGNGVQNFLVNGECVYQNTQPGTLVILNSLLLASNNFGNPGQSYVDNGDIQSSPSNPPSESPQSVGGSCQNGCSSTNEPINTATGNEFEIERDFAGAPSTGLSLTRYYNSMDNSQTAFGTGWHDLWHRGLINIQINNGGTSSVTALRADGRQDIFTLNSSNQWVGQPNVTSHLVTVMNGAVLQGWQLTLADDTVETYLPNGQLVSIVTRAGLTTTLAYDNAGDLASVTGPFGNQMSFSYDASVTPHRIVGMVAPDGTAFAYAYDANNNLIGLRYPDQTIKQYLYENMAFPHALTGIIDENNSRYVTIAYDTQGRAVQTQFAGGVDLTKIAYNSDGSSSVTDANNNTHTLSFSNEFGILQTSGLTGAPDPAVGGSAFAYDANGFLASKTDFDGHITTFIHDALGNELSRTQASGMPLARTFSTTWTPNFHLPLLITEPNSRTTAFTYDAHGNQLGKTITAGTEIRSWAWTYNADGQATSMTDPDGNVTTYTYDTLGDLASVKDTLGHLIKFTSYDGAGRLLSMTDPNGLVTTMTYDARGRLLSRKVGTELTSFAYDAVGNLLHVTMPDGSFKTYVYDAAHRLTHVFDALNNQLAITLDGNSNRTNISAYDPSNTLQQTRSFAYDNVNRLLAEQGAQGQITNYTYDPVGNLLSKSDPLDHVTAFAYDALNRRIQSIDPEGGVSGYAYDIVDDLLAQSDPRNLVTDYGYDGLSDQTGSASPDAGTTIRTFDAAGNVISSTDARGAKTIYSYDDLHRLVEAKYADGSSSKYQYDQGTNGIGHLTKMIDPSGTTTYSYDQHGRITQKIQQTGSVHLTTKYAYDTAGRLVSIQYPSGKIISITYDAAGQVAGLSQNGHALASNVIHRPFGPASAWKQGNGITFARNFDLDGRIISITGNNSLAYSYDAANRIMAFAETGFANEQYGYDALDRLTGFMDGTNATTYSYDANGNRLKLDAPGTAIDQVYAYDAASNRLLKQTSGLGKTADADNYNYDAAGNTLTDGDHTFTYDARGRMATVMTNEDERHNNDHFGFWSSWNNHKKETKKTEFAINGLGERVVKASASETIIYAYDEAGHITGEYDGRGNVLEETVYLGDTPIAVLGGGSMGDWGQHFILPFGLNSQDIHYISTDNIGAPHIITDARGHKAWEWHHTPFGDSQPQEMGFIYNLRFPGQIYDPESGLNYNMARDYNSETGRYNQPDPIGLAGGVNMYGYVRENPVTLFDFLGLDCTDSTSTHVAQEIPPILEEPPLLEEPPTPPVESFPTDPTQPPGPGFEWRGQPGSTPGDSNGNWYNPYTHETLRPDLNHPNPIGPHYDYKAPDGNWYRWFPDGRIVGKITA